VDECKPLARGDVLPDLHMRGRVLLLKRESLVPPYIHAVVCLSLSHGGKGESLDVPPDTRGSVSLTGARAKA
jgi:hypothetical protein